MSRKEFRSLVGYAICALPLVGALFADFLPLSVRGQQFLVLIALIWFQLFILLEVLLAPR